MSEIREKTYVKIEDRDKFDALGRDPSLAVKQKLAERRLTETRTAWNGSSFGIYRKDSPTASIGDAQGGIGAFLFDPRLIGLDYYMNEDWDIEKCVVYRWAKSSAISPAPPANGKRCWYVNVTTHNDNQYQLRIEDAAPFRVHNVQFVAPGGTLRFTIESDYGDNLASTIPKKVVIRRFGQNGDMDYLRELVVNSVGALQPGSFDVGSLGSLGMPLGTEVWDERERRRIGYWDGEKVSKDRVTPLPASSSAAKEVAWSSWTRVAVVLGVAVIVIAGAVYFGLRRKSGMRSAS